MLFRSHNDICVPYLLHYGTEEQKKKWIPKACSGELITAVAMALVVDGFGGRVLLGAFLAFVIATLVSFVGNALWSFEARPTPAKAAMFFAVNTVGLGLNMVIAWLLERAGVHYLLISLTVLIVVPLFNFAGHRLITFARPG